MLVESATGFVLELIIYLRYLGVVSDPNLHSHVKAQHTQWSEEV